MQDRDYKLIGTLHIVLSSLGLLAAVIVLFVLGTTGLLSGDPTAMAVLSSIGGAVSLLLFILFLPGFIGGIGMLRGASWAPVLLTVVSVLNLMNLPLGTAVGIFTLIRLYDATGPESELSS
jgi:hypothetical protein